MHFIKMEVMWILINLLFGNQEYIEYILTFEMDDPSDMQGNLGLKVLPLVNQTILD